MKKKFIFTAILFSALTFGLYSTNKSFAMYNNGMFNMGMNNMNFMNSMNNMGMMNNMNMSANNMGMNNGMFTNNPNFCNMNNNMINMNNMNFNNTPMGMNNMGMMNNIGMMNNMNMINNMNNMNFTNNLMGMNNGMFMNNPNFGNMINNMNNNMNNLNLGNSSNGLLNNMDFSKSRQLGNIITPMGGVNGINKEQSINDMNKNVTSNGDITPISSKTSRSNVSKTPGDYIDDNKNLVTDKFYKKDGAYVSGYDLNNSNKNITNKQLVYSVKNEDNVVYNLSNSNGKETFDKETLFEFGSKVKFDSEQLNNLNLDKINLGPEQLGLLKEKLKDKKVINHIFDKNFDKETKEQIDEFFKNKKEFFKNKKDVVKNLDRVESKISEKESITENKNNENKNNENKNSGRIYDLEAALPSVSEAGNKSAELMSKDFILKDKKEIYNKLEPKYIKNLCLNYTSLLESFYYKLNQIGKVVLDYFNSERIEAYLNENSCANVFSTIKSEIEKIRSFFEDIEGKAKQTTTNNKFEMFNQFSVDSLTVIDKAFFDTINKFLDVCKKCNSLNSNKSIEGCFKSKIPLARFKTLIKTIVALLNGGSTDDNRFVVFVLSMKEYLSGNKKNCSTGEEITKFISERISDLGHYNFC